MRRRSRCMAKHSHVFEKELCIQKTMLVQNFGKGQVTLPLQQFGGSSTLHQVLTPREGLVLMT